jgi:hypothetical protein
MTVLIGTAWYGNQTDVWKEYSTSTDIVQGIYPSVAGYHMNLIGRYDNSSVLGAGAHSYAMAYSNIQGQYYRAEAWTAPSGWRLEEYGVNDCLTFHGDQMLGRRNLVLPDNLHAHLFIVAIPPLQRGGGQDIYGVV